MRHGRQHGRVHGAVAREFPDPVTITLPKGQTPSFALAVEELTRAGAGPATAMAGWSRTPGTIPT